MEVTSLYKASRQLDGFYVPLFEVRIEGVGLPRDVLRDVTEITYRDSLDDIDGFEVNVNNWDPNTNAFKYVGAETAADIAGSSKDAARYKLFEPCRKEVKVYMGYLGNLTLMLTGQFITMEPSFPSSGAPTLSVRGLNVLHKLRRKQFTTTWTDKKDSEIARSLNDMSDPDGGGRRFPIPIRIDENAMSREEPIEYVIEDNLYDVDFLLQRARQRGYVVFVREDEDGEYLYFGPSQTQTEPIPYELIWGQSIIDFRPTLTTANQVRSVTVKGWNRRTKEPITETVSLDDLQQQRNQDLYRLIESNACGDRREEIVVNEPIFTVNEARRRAEAILSDQTKVMVKASATTVGLPELRAGRKVKISGLGARFSGTYFVTASTHTINDSGYTTRFDARREDDGGGTAS